MIDIVCWKWKPFKGYRSEFSAYNVNVLYDMVKRNTTVPFRFNCITDDPEGINPGIRIIPLWDDFEDVKSPTKNGPSCYRRLKIFSEEMKDSFPGKVLSIDLDCVIVGNIDDILNREEDFIILKGTAKKTAYNGGLWLAKVGKRPQFFDKFEPETSPCEVADSGCIGSDQGWLSYISPHEQVFSEKDGIYSFRDYFLKKIRLIGLPSNAKIIMFQGKADPWDDWVQNRYPWVRKFYRLTEEPEEEYSFEPDLTCITFLWGEAPYNYKYVNRLFNMIDRHLSYPHKNVCFTNIPEGIREGIEIKPLTNEWMKDNLKKTIQFDPDNGLKGRILSFDLDNVIIGSLDMYAEYTDEFCICEAVNPKRKGKCGGNFMSFEAGYGKDVWQKLNKDYNFYKKATRGSERFLYDRLIKRMTFWPKETIVSYRQQVRKGKVKDWSNVRMIWNHGFPKLHQIKDKIVVDNWK